MEKERGRKGEKWLRSEQRGKKAGVKCERVGEKCVREEENASEAKEKRGVVNED